MPPKPTKDMEDTLQSILDKLATFQTQLHTVHYQVLQETLEACQAALESKQDTITHTLIGLFTTLSSQTTSISLSVDFAYHFTNFSLDATSSIPPHVINNSHATFTTSTTTTIPPHSSFPLPSTTIRPPKIQLSFFDGLDWLFQADQFFQFYNIPWDSHLNMVDFCMQDDALS